MATPRLLPLPFYANMQTQYVCAAPIGSDLNAGYSELYPKETWLAAYDALPANGGIIKVMGAVHVGGEVPGQGIRIGDNGNQAFPGWRASKPLTVFGYASGPINGLFSLSQAEILPGRVGDMTKPTDRQDVGLWLAGTAHSMYFNGLLFQKFGIPHRVAVGGDPAIDPDADGPQRGVAQTVANSRFDLCTFQTPNASDGRQMGPCVDMGYFLFVWYRHCSGNQANLDQPYLSDRRAAWLVRPYHGSSQLFLDTCYGANNGVVYYNGIGGATNWSVNINAFLTEGSEDIPLPPVVKLVGCDNFGSGFINNVVGADSLNVPTLVDNSAHAGMDPGNLVVVLGNGAGGEVLGPADVQGGFSAGFPTILAMPSAKGQISLMGDRVAGDMDAPRWNTPVITNRLYNMVPQRDGAQGLVGNVINPPDIDHQANRVWTQAGATGSGTVNSPIPDRRGTNTGIRISTNDASQTFQRLFYAAQNVAAGDVWVFGAWVRSPSGNLVTPPLAFTMNPAAGASTYTTPASLTPVWGHDGQWQFVRSSVKCLTAAGGATGQVNLYVQADPGLPVDIDQYMICKIAAGAMSANEIGNLMQSLAAYVQAPVGAATTQPGQLLIAQGGLGVGNAVAATTPGSVVKKVQLFDAFGNSLGYVPVYGSIT